MVTIFEIQVSILEGQPTESIVLLLKTLPTLSEFPKFIFLNFEIVVENFRW